MLRCHTRSAANAAVSAINVCWIPRCTVRSTSIAHNTCVIGAGIVIANCGARRTASSDSAPVSHSVAARNARARRVEVANDRKRVNRAKVRVAKAASVNTSRTAVLWDGITMREIGVQVGVLPRRFIQLAAQHNLVYDQPDYPLYEDEALEVCSAFGIQHRLLPRPKDAHPSPPLDEDTAAKLPRRPPVVTIMGHVDHGKTTLLDYLRHSKVAQGEAGGITQRIGAFRVTTTNSSIITFLDTPGHAAFSEMRARGAKVTDIVVLVVAADDGVMPQTIESIKFANAASVPIIVAISKCDRPEANPSKVKEMLMDYGIYAEELGGETPVVEISGKTGDGVSELIDTIGAVAETKTLPLEENCRLEGSIIEASLNDKSGIAASILVTRGKLHLRDSIVAGESICRVRSMVDDTGTTLKEIGPSSAATLSGWKSLPKVGDVVIGVENPKNAEKVVQFRESIQLLRNQLAEEEHRLEEKENATLELINKSEFGNNESEDTTEDTSTLEIPQCNIVVKADVSGSLEALISSLMSLGQGKIDLKVVASGVGAVQDRDIDLAKTTNAIIIAFNTGCGSKAVEKNIVKEGLDYVSHQVIYFLLDELKARLQALLPERLERKQVGVGKGMQTFLVTTNGVPENVIGCQVETGKVVKNKGYVTVMRNGEPIYKEVRIHTLRHFKKDVDEVFGGKDCGVGVGNFKLEIEPGDQIIFLEEVIVKDTLE